MALAERMSSRARLLMAYKASGLRTAVVATA
jgi:hypothetical protein